MDLIFMGVATFAVVTLACITQYQQQQIDNLRCDLFRYSTQDYVMNRFSNVWSEVNSIRTKVDKLERRK